MDGRLIILGAALAAALAGAAQAAPAPQAIPGGPTAEDGYFEIVQRIDQGVWLIRQEKPFHLQPIGNVTVIEQADGLVMVDAGGSPGSGRRIAGLVKGLSRKPVKAVILTHWHGDHPLGLSEILKAWPRARVIGTAATRAHLRDPKTMNTPGAPDEAGNKAMLDRQRGILAFIRDSAAKAPPGPELEGWRAVERLFTQYVQDMDGALTLAPGEAFVDRLEIVDPAAPVEARFLGRANTDGDALVWLPRQRILVTGDVVVSPVPYGFGSYPGDWLGVLEKVSAYDFRLLVPGHGEPQTDRAYLERVASLIREVRAQVAPLAAQGLSLDEVRKRVDLGVQARGFVGDDPWRRRWFDQYWTQPIVSSAYKEARGEPIVQSLG